MSEENSSSLLSSARGGSEGVRSEDPNKFPFDAFEVAMTDPDSPKLITKEAWNLNAETLENLSLQDIKDLINAPHANPRLVVEDQKTSGTDGGSFTSGVWQTRDLNIKVVDDLPGASLTSNRVTLPSGTYKIKASAPAYYVNGHKIRLRNITDSFTIHEGTTEFSWKSTTNYIQTRSFLDTTFTITETSVFEIQHRCDSTGGEGFGKTTGFAVSHETYTTASFEKIG